MSKTLTQTLDEIRDVGIKQAEDWAKRGQINSGRLGLSLQSTDMDQRAENACGGHGFNANGNPQFDYTCDDCMLPWNHVDPENNEEENEGSTEFTQTEIPF